MTFGIAEPTTELSIAVKKLRPLNEWPLAERRCLLGVMTDIDDTLTTEGYVAAAVVGAMEALRSAGLLVIPITGRPAGWCDMIARTWPVDGVVGENGAFYFRHDRKSRRVIRRFADPEAVRAEKRAHLATIREEVLSRVPGADVASDQAYRDTDLAIDYREDVDPLPADAVREIVGIFEKHGATAKVSSIHVNGWFGDYNKLVMTRHLMSEVYKVDLDQERANYTFIGDSPNDGPMFGYFPNAVAVANFRGFEQLSEALPAWSTQAEAGLGFVEFAEAVLASRR